MDEWFDANKAVVIAVVIVIVVLCLALAAHP